MMKRLDKATLILAKLVEVGHWIAAVSMVVVLVLSLLMGADVVQDVSLEDFGASLTTYGFSVTIVDNAGGINMTSLRLFCVGAAVLLSLMAMVFRNIWLIMKRSENTTPFQKDNVRLVREIGIFMLAVPLTGLAINVLIRLVVGVDAVETSESLSGLLAGLVVLCLSRFFARGVELEEDTEGLV